MKKRAKICLYVFLVCAFCALGILGYFVFNPSTENVMVGSRKFVTFSEVPYASSYSMSVQSLDSEDFTEYVAKYKVQKVATKGSEYSFKIEVFSSDDAKIAQETYTQQITSKNKDENKIDCIILDYTVDFFNESGELLETRTYLDQTLKGVDEDIICCVLSEYFDNLFKTDDSYTVLFTAYDEIGNVIENSETEFKYDYYAYYERDFLRRDNFYINGNWYDYIINSKQELKQLVWHTILYRKNNVTFYVKTNDINSSNINSIVVDAINSYPEYDALKDTNLYASMEEKIGKLENFNYYLDENFTKNYKDLKSLDENTYKKAESYLHCKDDTFKLDYIARDTSNSRTFKINSSNRDEVLVNNTEQLFMVVQYGDRPVFSDEAIVAQTVYENALLILEQINNSDDLSDYEKSLNIYRYLCNNVCYDWVIYKYMSFKNDFSIINFGNYSCFYLEGVFYDLDNQYAVCDGLSKAYVLLCNIEGIDCVKVNGTADGGNHAWNKLFLNDENYNVDGWYNVDITWGVGGYSENKNGKTVYYEYPTNIYFLALGDETRVINFEANIDEEAVMYDYYYNTEYNFNSYSGNYYIESDDELIEIFDYAEYLLGKGESNVLIEIKIDEDYVSETNSLIFKFMFLYNWNASNIDLRNWFTSAGVSSLVGCKWFVLDDVILFKFY